MSHRQQKDLMYEQVARIGSALSSPKRLEMIDLLGQGEKTVEALAAELAVDVRLASAHLRALREARLVESRSEGKYRVYRLSGPDVAGLWVVLREAAERHLLELQQAVTGLLGQPEALEAVDHRALMARARRGEVLVLDVRPAEEYRQAHLPYARSLPLAELTRRLRELPRDTEIVAYCRGPFCIMSAEAVILLKRRGYRARQLRDGVAEWRAAGGAVASSTTTRRGVGVPAREL